MEVVPVQSTRRSIPPPLKLHSSSRVIEQPRPEPPIYYGIHCVRPFLYSLPSSPRTGRLHVSNVFQRAGSDRRQATTPLLRTQALQVSRPQDSQPTSALMNTEPSANTDGRPDQFALCYYDQGWPIPDSATAYTTHSDVVCPYHGVILRNARPRNTSSSTAAHELIARMPPTGFTCGAWVGTASSSSCTCGQAKRDDIREFAQEVDATNRPRGRSTDLPARRG